MISSSEQINNDNHPIDQGLDAEQDHWGTTKMAGDVVQGPTGGEGPTLKASPYRTGTKSDPKVTPFPKPYKIIR